MNAPIIEIRRIFLGGLTFLMAILISVSVGAEGGGFIGEDTSTPTVAAFQFTGAASSRVSIVVPPGRKNIAPTIALTYNSFHKNGWVGVGWDLDMGSIQRSTKRGVCYSCDDFVAKIGGSSSELVLRTDWKANYYGAKIEGAFSKYYYDYSGNGGWVVTLKDGSKYFYGTTAASRQHDPGNPGRVFKWNLDRVEDTNGNYMTISYTKDQGQIYLDQIDYTGNGSLNPGNYVKFHLDPESRTDVYSMYDTGFSVVTAKRLKRIEIYGNGLLSRTYELSYTYSGSSSRSVLDFVRQYGSDGQSLLNEVSIGWPEWELGFSNEPYGDLSLNATMKGSPWNWLGDFNGDGKTDIASWVPGTGTQIRVHYSTGNGFTSALYSGMNLNITSPGSAWNWLGDFNGDGKTDIASWVPGTGTQIRVHYSTGNGFTNTLYSGMNLNITSPGSAWNWLGDFNGDGKTDIASWVPGTGTQIRVHFSTGNGFTAALYSGMNLNITSPGSAWNWLGDFNGDGKTDIASWVPGTGTQIRVHFSTGNGFTAALYSGMNLNGTTPGSAWNWLRDFNGDGKTDIVSWVPGTGTQIRVHLATGDGFTNQLYSGMNLNITSPGSAWNWLSDFNGDGKADIASWVPGTGTQIRVHYSTGNGFTNELYSGMNLNGTIPGLTWNPLGDFNGDGKTDIASWVPFTNGQEIRVHYSSASLDLLASLSNGIGGTTTIKYTPSSSYQNALMPFIIHPVSSITTDDGIAETEVTTITYEYSGGFFDFGEREFRGFETVTQINPDGTTSKTWFHQDDYLKGKQYQIDFRASSGGMLLSSTTLYWSNHIEHPPAGAYAFVKLDQKLSEVYDSETVFSQEEYFYDDSNGNLLSKSTFGTNAEGLTVENLYANFGDWIWRKTRETLKNQLNDTIRESYFEYETATGNLLFKEFWLDNGTNPRFGITYDAYGNQVTLTDANNNPPTVTEYDTVTYIYPLKVTNPLGHTFEYQYDYRFGKVLSEKDPNNNWTYYSFDLFGRTEQVNFPDGGQVITEFYDDVFPRYVVTKAKEDASGTTIDSYQYYDGFGRKIQSISLGEARKTIVTKAHYDNMGRNYRNEGPFFSTLIGWPIATPTDSPYAETTYDERGRPTEVETPLGQDVEQGSRAVAKLSYSGFSTTVEDPDGGKKTEKKDCFGRVVKVTEYGDTGEIFTSYDYNAVGDLLTVAKHSGHTTTVNYDSLGRKINMTDPDMGYWQYTYDANGNLKTQIDAKNQTITFIYDAGNRMISKSYSTADPTVTYTYDELSIDNGFGRLYRVENAHAVTTIDSYDALGRELSTTRTISGAPAGSYTTSFTYDLSGKVTATTYPDNYQVNYDYHPGSALLHTVTGITDFTEYAEFTGYEPTGKMGDIYHGNGAQTAYTYDPKSTRLLSIQTLDPYLADIQEKTYKYTAAGEITRITDTTGGRNITYNYGYDELHRLISETNTGAQDGFDSAILIKTFDDNAPIHAVKSIDLAGVLYPYQYDANGNMTNGWDFTDPTQVASRTIEYNADNMPIRIDRTYSGNTATVYLSYDSGGTRVKKAVEGGTTIYYVGGHFEVAAGVATKYIFGGNLRIAKVTPTTKQFFHKDRLGSSTAMTSYPDSHVIETAEYLPFGLSRIQTGTEVTYYKFTDQELDAETGLYNYNARLYDPAIGIFISPDSIVPNPYDPQTLNRYSYCRNNPLIYVDPSGHNPFVIGAIVGAVIGAVSSGAQNDWDAGTMLQGAAMGAITGAFTGGIFYGAGEIIASGVFSDALIGSFQTISTLEQAGIHVAAGAISGGINSGITGGDVGLGMLTGAASGGIGKFVGGYLPNNKMWQYAGRTAIAGGVGGGAQSLAGGNFWTGAAWGAGTAAFGYTFNELWHEIYPDWGVHPNIRSISAGGKIPGIGTDTHYDVYTRGKGTMTLERSQSLTANFIAAGGTITFDGIPSKQNWWNIQIDAGLGNYLGLSYNPHQGTVMVNFGGSVNLFNLMGSPLAFSVPLDP